MDLRTLLPVVIAFIVVSIALSIGSDIVATIQSDQTTGAYDYNASENGLSGIDSIATWLPTIGIVIGASVVIGSLIFYFARAGS